MGSIVCVVRGGLVLWGPLSVPQGVAECHGISLLPRKSGDCSSLCLIELYQ